MMKKMKLTLDGVGRVATLARLPLDDKQLHSLRTQLSSIIDFISRLQKIQTNRIVPTAHVTGLFNIFREDEVDPTHMLSQEDALRNAPAVHNGYFRVPAIFDE